MQTVVLCAYRYCVRQRTLNRCRTCDSVLQMRRRSSRRLVPVKTNGADHSPPPSSCCWASRSSPRCGCSVRRLSLNTSVLEKATRCIPRRRCKRCQAHRRKTGCRGLPENYSFARRPREAGEYRGKELSVTDPALIRTSLRARLKNRFNLKDSYSAKRHICPRPQM